MADKEKNKGLLPSQEEYLHGLARRQQRGTFVRYYYYFSIILAMVVLVTLFLTVINRAFGSAAFIFEIEPDYIAQTYGDGTPIGEMNAETLARIIDGEAANGLLILIRDELSQVANADFVRVPIREVLAGQNYPEAYADQLIRDIGTDGLIEIVTANFDEGFLRDYVTERIVGLQAVAAWTLYQAIFQFEKTAEQQAALDDIEARIQQQRQFVDELPADAPNRNVEIVNLRQLEQEERDIINSSVQLAADFNHPNAELVRYHAWLNADFITSPMASRPTNAGIRGAAIGTIYLMAIVILFSLPVGVGTAIYLEEYTSDNALKNIIQTNVRNLAGVPSIIYGMLGLSIFVIALQPIMSGQVFGSDNDSGRTVLSAGLTLGLLILPIIIISAQEALRAVPFSLREASYGLGATHWQTIWRTVLPAAAPGILTGTILAVSRAIGETAPLVVIGASSFLVIDPDGPFSQFSAIPLLIYQWSREPEGQLFREIAGAAIIVLLVMMLTLNAVAIVLRNRYAIKY